MLQDIAVLDTEMFKHLRGLFVHRICDRLYSLRQYLKMRPSEFANIIHIQENLYFRRERDLRLQIHDLIEFCQYLDITSDYFYSEIPTEEWLEKHKSDPVKESYGDNIIELRTSVINKLISIRGNLNEDDAKYYLKNKVIAITLRSRLKFSQNTGTLFTADLLGPAISILGIPSTTLFQCPIKDGVLYDAINGQKNPMQSDWK
jgi:hypothetical protein